MMKTEIKHTFTCDCCNKAEITLMDYSNLDFQKVGWELKSTSRNKKTQDVVPLTVWCKDCVEADRLRKYNSSDIQERCYTDYYQNNPGFEEDAIKYVGLEGHPKADKAFSMAYDRGHSEGHSMVLEELKRLAELLL